MTDMTELMKQLAPIERTKPLLPDLTPQAELALLCLVLFREGYNDHIAGHISYKQPDGTLLMNPWELAWDEVCADDILRIDAGTGKVLEGDWNITPRGHPRVALSARLARRGPGQLRAPGCRGGRQDRRHDRRKRVSLPMGGRGEARAQSPSRSAVVSSGSA